MKKCLFFIGIMAFLITPSAYAVKRYGEIICYSSNYNCLKVNPGDTWASVFPNPRDRDIAQRINRMNTRLIPGTIIAVPAYADKANFWTLAPLPTTIATGGKKLVYVDIPKLAFAAYNPDGRMVFWGPISAGADFCKDLGKPCHTVTGEYHFYHTRGAGCTSSLFPIGKGGDPMPFCMFYKDSYAMHGSPALPGYNASHGCIRMFPRDAQWLYNFIDQPKSGSSATKVIVRG